MQSARFLRHLDIAMAPATLALLTVIGAVAPLYSAAAVESSLWSYRNDMTGPTYWARIVDELGALRYPACGGASQSPVDLRSSSPLVSNLPLRMTGTCTTSQMAFEMEEFKWTYLDAFCSAVGLGGSPHKLLQFHVHSPAEHTVDGVRADAEVHFVHKTPEGHLLVIGVMLKVQTGVVDPLLENAWISSAFKHIPCMSAPGSIERVVQAVLNPLDLIPATGGFYSYQGSLTQPPCSESVEWWVARKPVLISYRQLQVLRSQQAKSPMMNAYGDNNRPVQPLNGRIVTKYG